MNSITFTLISLVCISALLSGCNTVRGIGEDLEAAGRAIQTEADTVRDGD